MDLLVITREFPPHVLGGISYHLSYLYEEVNELGHDITVITGKCPESEKVSFDLVPDNTNIHTVPFGSRQGYHIRFSVALWRFLTEFDTSAYDAALLHTPIPFSLQIPTITKYHDSEREERKYRPPRDLSNKILDELVDPTRRWNDQRSLTVSDQAIFVSHLCRRSWENHYNVPCETNVIHNGVDLSIFYPREERNHQHEYILFVGSEERKGISRVLEYAKNAPHEVWIVGPSQINQPNVKALGRVSPEELAQLYNDAVITIHPAHFEAFGNIILESLACGTPVVATDDCGASEIIDQNCGVVTDNLHQGVCEAENLDSKACLETARKYTWENVAKRTTEVISQVVE
ncbi:Glycosyltransferase involved in cell wall bisynthesis [Haladaptatus litoreus]|uniref:Glycosyltransferase involved in cell wall bisynthesis n=1 Tax=Haladaptatus litoreus TaxID=553468 RepID=A0A1N7DC06_9EURY|nr:glycosyltransferase family 4 protein [Haladaptatus litoreus]SIR73275.1 Glycosyltransferase involved in cell wall bisynthesis [Haladaptatus litoreus]